jgi:hypothetical protein
MLQLLQRNPDAAPREETVKMQVKTFREKVATLLNAKGAADKNEDSKPTGEENVAKLVEEVKGMLRELPDRFDDRAGAPSRRTARGGRGFDPRMLDELFIERAMRDLDNGPAVSWLFALSLLRDEMPWLYEPGMEFYRSLISKSEASVKKSALQLHHIIEFAARTPLRDMIGSDDKFHFIISRLHDLIERAVDERPRRSRLREI